jgi:hypothetical protein
VNWGEKALEIDREENFYFNNLIKESKKEVLDVKEIQER